MFVSNRFDPGLVLVQVAALVSFFFPGLTLVVIPGLFPETGFIFCAEFQLEQPLGAFPEIALGDQEYAPENRVLV